MTKEQDDIIYEEDEGAELIKKLRARLKTCEQEKKEYLDGWQRLKADNTNKAKTEAEVHKRLTQRAVSNVLESFLPSLDSFDLALEGEMGKGVDATWRQGIEHIYAQLREILQSHGFTQFGEVGDTFDPTLHEAVGKEEGGEAHTIASVQRKGYMHHTAVVRPAHVIIFE
tara:strand:+ start:4113 stop:4622 length:510 start_codon:yes stop_codon:yes gene_type:complete